MHGPVASLQGSRVKEDPFSDCDIMIPDIEECWQHQTCSYRLYTVNLTQSNLLNLEEQCQLHELAIIVHIHHSIFHSTVPFHNPVQ